MGRKKNTKKKVKQPSGETTKNTAPDAMELKLNTLEIAYNQYYQDFGRLCNTGKLFAVVDEENVLQEEAEELFSSIQADIASLNDFVDYPYIDNIFYGKAILIYIRLSALCGKIHLAVKKLLLAHTCYSTAIGLLDEHHSKLNYKDDILFQLIVKDIFKLLYSTSYETNDNGKEIKRYYAGLDKTYAAFKKHCGDGITKSACLFEELIKLLGNPDIKKNNPFLKEKREEFNRCIRNINAQFEKMKSDNAFTTEYQLYNIDLNYAMVRIDEFTHPRAIFFNNPEEGTWQFSQLDKPVDLDGAYLDHWLSLKETWLIPAMQLIANINHDDITANPELRHNFMAVLDTWFAGHVIWLDAFGYSASELLLWIPFAAKLPAYARKKVDALIFKLEPVISFLLSGVELLSEYAAKYQHKFLMSSVEVDPNVFITSIHGLQEKINQFKLDWAEQTEEKSKIAKLNAKQLIEEEEKEKKEKLAMLALKLKRRYVSRCEKAINYDEPEENIAPENRLDLEAVTLISAELMDLQQVDIAVLQLADNLKTRSMTLLDFLQPFSKLNTPLTSDLRRELLEKMNLMLFEYQQLITLNEKYKLLIGTQEIQRDASIQEGIGMGCSELKKLSEKISQNIQTILSSFDEIIKLQKQNRENKIRQLGQQKAAECGLTHLTDKEIMEMGRQVYISIGEKKTANKQKLSEFTLQKDFLDDMQLNFASFDYLQQKMKPYINENHNEALLAMNFFARPKSNGAYSAWSLASIEGLLGLTLRCQYDKCGDVAYLHQASLHFRKAHNIFEAEKNVDGMNKVAGYLAGIEEILASKQVVGYGV